MFLKLVIRYITILGVMCLIQNTSMAQENILEKKISVSFIDADLSIIIKSIDKQLNGVFSYQENILPKNKKVTINEQNKTLKEILNKIFGETKIGFREFGGKIILNREAELKKVTLSGVITDKSSGEHLIGANVFVQESSSGAASNQYGFYSITLDEGIYTLLISYVGYKPETIAKIELSNSLRLNVELETTSLDLEEIIVSDKNATQNIESMEMGVNEFSPKTIERIPVLFGEQDIIKAVQLLPGVSNGGEGSSGFLVRGGSIDQNQILLDEAPVYNPSHLLGFFSTFNSDVIKNVKLIKGNFPSEYGGRLSSIMDVKMNEGNNKQFGLYGGVGIIASRLAIEGPIENGKSSFLISGRRTYADLFIPMVTDTDAKLYFYDLNAKVNFVLGENDRLYLSGYLGRDVFSVKRLFGFNWGNITSTLRWNHIFGDNLFMNLTGIYSKYDYVVEVKDQDGSMLIKSGISDINFKADFEYYYNDLNTFKFGLQIIKHQFLAGDLSSSGTSNFNSYKIPEVNAFESAIYGGDEMKLSDKLNINYGIRLSNYSMVGPGTAYYFDEKGNSTSKESVESGVIKSYNGFEPRFSAVYTLPYSNSIKAAYSRNMQYLHLLSSSNSSTPTDIWQSSTNNVKPGISDQVSVGYFQNFTNNMYEFSVETYYKNLKNQVDFKSGADILLNEYVEGELVFGKGWSYGIELMFQKKMGDFTGWIGYTLSKTEMKFPGIDNGKVFPAKQDRTHNISIVGMYKINDTWDISMNWVYYTGSAVTFPNGKYYYDGETISYYTQRNGYRMPDYHRLDLGITYNFSSKSSLNLSVYNAYGRKNAYTITFQENKDNPNQTEAVRLALFSVFPSLTYNFRF